MGPIASLYAALDSWVVATLATGVTLIFAVVLFPASARKFRPPGGKHIVHLQLAFTVERFRSIVLGWVDVIPDSVKWLKESVVKLDYLFPVLYATAFASVYASISDSNVPTNWDLFFVLVPFIAGVFDWIENTMHLIVLGGIHDKSDIERASFDPTLIFFASSAASMKFLLLAVSVIGWVIAIVQVIV